MISAGHPGRGTTGDPELPFGFGRKTASEKGGGESGKQDHGPFAPDGASAGDDQQRRQGFYKAGTVIKLAVPGLQRLHVIGWCVRALGGQSLPSPEQYPGGQPTQRRRQRAPPGRERCGGIHQATAVVAEKQPLQQVHAVTKHRNGQRRQHAGDGGNQQSAKHRPDVGVSMKTLHGSQLQGNDTILWREIAGLAKGMRAKAPGEARPEGLTVAMNIQCPTRTPGTQVLGNIVLRNLTVVTPVLIHDRHPAGIAFIQT